MNNNVNGQGEISTVYESIVRALSEDYFDLYYVNVETGEYIEYGSITEAGKKSTEIHGTDFFTEILKKAKEYIFDDFGPPGQSRGSKTYASLTILAATTETPVPAQSSMRTSPILTGAFADTLFISFITSNIFPLGTGDFVFTDTRS